MFLARREKGTDWHTSAFAELPNELRVRKEKAAGEDRNSNHRREHDDEVPFPVGGKCLYEAVAYPKHPARDISAFGSRPVRGYFTNAEARR